MTLEEAIKEPPMAEPTQEMRRYEVPVDGQPHTIESTTSPFKVAARTIDGQEVVEFWAPYMGGMQYSRTYEVFGTGHPIPGNAIWCGTADRTTGGFVWHLFELPGARRG